MISIIIPFYKMKNYDEYLSRCIKSIRSQTYQNYEILVMEKGSASHNINCGVKEAQGSLIKILCMDDYFTHKNALKDIIECFSGDWLIHGVSNHKNPIYTGDIHLGNNRLGGLSSIVFKKESFIPFDESLVWLLDCDWYKQMYAKYGMPDIIKGDFVTIEEGDGQATNKISKIIKNKEVMILRKKYV